MAAQLVPRMAATQTAAPRWPMSTNIWRQCLREWPHGCCCSAHSRYHCSGSSIELTCGVLAGRADGLPCSLAASAVLLAAAVSMLVCEHSQAATCCLTALTLRRQLLLNRVVPSSKLPRLSTAFAFLAPGVVLPDGPCACTAEWQQQGIQLRKLEAAVASHPLPATHQPHRGPVSRIATCTLLLGASFMHVWPILGPLSQWPK